MLSAQLGRICSSCSRCISQTVQRIRWIESHGCHMINRHSNAQLQNVKLVSFVKYRTFSSNFNLYSISNTRLANQTESISKTTSFPYMVIFRSYSQRSTHKNQSPRQQSNKTTVTYMIAIAIVVVGLSYAAVPLYRIFCQATGYGGTVIKTNPSDKIEKMLPVEERELTIRFNCDKSSGMRWNFKPLQKEIKISPGETALAFYTATNPTDEPITGIATYNVIPFEAGQYFNKIQCFCFEEQRLNPKEEVDMPVFFYIDPEFDEDPNMAKVETITLSYTFFEAKDGDSIEIPSPNSLHHQRL